MSNKKASQAHDLSTDDVDNFLPDPLIRTAYDGRNVAMSEATGIMFDPEIEPSKTKQSFADECDINNILEHFNKTGVLTHYNERQPVYGDFTDPISFQESLNLVIQAHEMFDALPSKIRERFHNDPQEFLDFASDEKNKDEMISLGLIEAPPAAPVDPVPPVDPAAGGAP